MYVYLKGTCPVYNKWLEFQRFCTVCILIDLITYLAAYMFVFPANFYAARTENGAPIKLISEGFINRIEPIYLSSSMPD